MATLKDVAAKSGVTVTTVSRVLNNRGYISEETREKVYKAMKELNYQPNEIARSLSKQKSNILGVIVPHIEHPYFAKLIEYLERAASKQNYRIMLCNSHSEFEKEIDYLEMFQSNRVAGIMLCSSNVDIGKFISLNIPVVSYERNVDVGTTSIECDNFQGGVLAATHLIECGCKNLLHFSGIENEKMPADERCNGFIHVCQKEGVRHQEIQCLEDDYYKMDYRNFIEKVLKEKPEVDGIFASSDVIAAQVIQVAKRVGKSIPDDIKLVGFDDVNVATLTSPTITTIHQPVKEMAYEAIGSLIKSAENAIVPSKIMLPVSLIKRESTSLE
ncbi:LacI family DNA-binding transcriptional regulator [Anaeromicropila herbilytica]|uniref:LacI family transcriptional regulator n=1 Tax=Anaeromicropila herbilytica TaxID=2785025 RepID=A0A7R7IF04_9FIRM|nr:LacI family DNA-binding transcriptional regulator [Anaeromicropila herbilytica]BCN32674.1 LacI family transcriptional regulator [Anaeromicropila herbilytica]